MLAKVLKRIVITFKSTQTNKQKELLVWGGAHRILAVCLRPRVQFPIMKKTQKINKFNYISLKKSLICLCMPCVSGWNWSSGIVDVAQDGFELVILLLWLLKLCVITSASTYIVLHLAFHN